MTGSEKDLWKMHKGYREADGVLMPDLRKIYGKMHKGYREAVDSL